MIQSFEIDKTVLSQLMHYEWLQHYVFNGSIDETWNPKEPSLLIKKSPFVVASFDYSIPEFIEALENQHWEKSSKLIKHRDCYFLITRYKENGYEELGEFEINFETYNFLKKQAQKPMVTNSVPESYKDVVDLGICQGLAH